MRRLLLGSTLLLASAALFAGQAPRPALEAFTHDIDQGSEVMDRIIAPGYLDGTDVEQIRRDVATLRAVRTAMDADVLAAVRESKSQELRRAIKDCYAAAVTYLADPAPQGPAQILARTQARGELTKARKMLQLEIP
jgi:hypothetical protein